uniref:Uncharacterized protein n=1 Tax=Daphnia magna TaxID=35525 RepID=A0A0P5DN52_9CRUS
MCIHVQYRVRDCVLLDSFISSAAYGSSAARHIDTHTSWRVLTASDWNWVSSLLFSLFIQLGYPYIYVGSRLYLVK